MKLISLPNKYISKIYSGKALPEYVFFHKYDCFLFFDSSVITCTGEDETFPKNILEFNKSIKAESSIFIVSLDEDFPSCYYFMLNEYDDDLSFLRAFNFPTKVLNTINTTGDLSFYNQFDENILNNDNRISLNSSGEGVGIFSDEPNNWVIYTNSSIELGVLAIRAEFLHMALQLFSEIMLPTKSAIYTQMKIAYHSSRYKLFDEDFQRLCDVYKINENYRYF